MTQTTMVNRPITQPLRQQAAETAVNTATSPWQHSENRQGSYLFRALWREGRALLLRYGKFRGNKSAYLRHLGVHIGDGCDILTPVKNFGTEPWLIELGNRVTITQGVIFLTHDGASRLFRQRLPDASPWGNRFGTIQIHDNSFIGVNTILMPNIKIGPNSIVGVGSVVNKDVAPNMVVAGVPARPICTLDEYIARYQQKSIPLTAAHQGELRRELTEALWGEAR